MTEKNEFKEFCLRKNLIYRPGMNEFVDKVTGEPYGFNSVSQIMIEFLMAQEEAPND